MNRRKETIDALDIQITNQEINRQNEENQSKTSNRRDGVENYTPTKRGKIVIP
jgi:hypothetical protein